MDYFESIIKTLLEHDGYWVRSSFKVNLTKAEKRYIGKPSIPRPEIDLLAYKPSDNQLLVLEAKSFLDSLGVQLKDLKESFPIPEGRYKLFTCDKYRETIISRLIKDLLELGMIKSNPKVRLGLVAGKIRQNKTVEFQKYMEKRGWFFWSPSIIRPIFDTLTHLRHFERLQEAVPLEFAGNLKVFLQPDHFM